MRILHTSDLHLGKKTNGISRLSEQAEILDEIISLCDTEHIDTVIIAGDVFDTFVPTAEAETLFFDKIIELAGKDRAVLIISGNHDDETRLTAASAMACRHGIYMFGNLSDGNYSAPLNRKTRLTRGGMGWCEISNGTDKVYFGMLPYPDEARFKETVTEGETYNEKMARWAANCFKMNTEHLPQILVAHLFALGGERSSSEREIDLGGTRAVPCTILPETCYTALGHLHKLQKMNSKNNVWYSGSILQYAFDEVGNEKSVNIFSVGKNGVEDLKTVKLTSGKKLARLSVRNISEAENLLKNYNDYYVELELLLESPLGERELIDFKREHPNVISLVLRLVSSETEELDFYQKRNMKPGELFDKYYSSRFGTPPETEIKELFMNLLGECEKESV